MACNDTPTCLPCNPCTTCDPCNPDYTDVGCCDIIPTRCVTYSGEDITCLNIKKYETLDQVLQHLKDVICPLGPGGFGDFDYGCFASVGITTEQEFVEFICDIICQILGTNTPGNVNSLSSLYALIQSLTTTVTTMNTQNLINCFATLTGLSTPQNLTNLLTGIQQAICNLDVRITALETGGIETNITVFNFEKDVELTAYGVHNHTLTARAILDPDLDNSITTSNMGLFCSSPVLSAVDTQSINFTTSGVKSHTITGDVKISANVGNALSIMADGLFVNPTYVSETPLTAIDSTSIDFTTSGVSNHTITGSIKLDPSLLNIAQITANGLLVSSALIQDPITPVDSGSVDLTVTGTSGHTLRADVVISSTAGNGLVLLPDGLYSASSVGNYWGLSGNSVLSTNFIGTTNSQPLNFRVNNVKSGRLYSSGDTSFGYQAGSSNTGGLITAVGYQASYLNTTGNNNTAVGSQALKNNLIGVGCTAIGDQSLLSSDGNYNTALGASSLQKLQTGVGNTAVGTFAGSNFSVGAELVGNYNTFLGFSAMNSNGEPNVSTSIAIGKNASVSADNMCVIGGTGADAVSVVIGDSEAEVCAIFETVSTTKGILLPRMTKAQRDLIPSPVAGLAVYQTDNTPGLRVYNGTNWMKYTETID